MKSEVKKELIFGKISAIKDLIQETLVELKKERNTDKASDELCKSIINTECFITAPVETGDYRYPRIDTRVDHSTPIESIKSDELKIVISSDNTLKEEKEIPNTFVYSFVNKSNIRMARDIFYLNCLNTIKKKLNYRDDDLFNVFDFYVITASTLAINKNYDLSRMELEKEFEDSKEDFCNLMNSLHTIKSKNCKFFTIKNDDGDISVLLAVKSFISIYELGIKNKILKLFSGNVPLDGLNLKISDLDLISLNWSFNKNNKMSNSPLFLYIKQQNLNMLQAKVLESILKLVANTVSTAGYKLKKSELNPNIVEIIPDEDATIKLESILNKL